MGGKRERLVSYQCKKNVLSHNLINLILIYVPKKKRKRNSLHLLALNLIYYKGMKSANETETISTTFPTRHTYIYESFHHI